jgi:NCS1 family nucleobase:cation symporter-1
MAGLGWFAVNSVSGALALTTLTGMPGWLSLIIIVVLEVLLAFVGHDLVQLFERYASIVLGVVFLVATIAVFANAQVGPAIASHNGFSFAGFTLTASAAFGYAAGWNPYASDYSRYLPKDVNRVKAGWAAGLGNFVSCTVLMAGGAAAALIADPKAIPTDAYVSGMPTWIGDITLVAIAIGAIAANALNVYSGAMSFLAAGVRIPFALRRAIIALGFGVLGFIIALVAVLNEAFYENYENFLLVIAYWIAPWLGIVLVDRILRRGTSIAEFIPDKAKYRNPSGIIAFIVAVVVSIVLFSNQSFFTGLVAQVAPIGDLTPLVGFVLAGLLYLVLFQVFKPKVGGPVDQEPDVVVGVDAADEVA